MLDRNKIEEAVLAAKPGRNAAQEAARKATAEPVVSSAHLAAGRSPGLSEVEFGLNLATMAYQRWMVRCMAAAGLIEVERAGKEKRVSASAAGIALCARYGEIRERLLVEAAAATGPGEASLDEVATVLRALSGIYNQAARAATTF